MTITDRQCLTALHSAVKALRAPLVPPSSLSCPPSPRGRQRSKTNDTRLISTADVRQALCQADNMIVDGDDRRRPFLQQAVGEAAGRRADIDAAHAGGVDAELFERAEHLLAATAHESWRWRQDFDRIARSDHRRRLVCDGTVDRHLAVGDPSLGLLAAGRQVAADEFRIESFPSSHGRRVRAPGQSARTREIGSVISVAPSGSLTGSTVPRP